ncbi:MAG: hypothetical protein Q9227_006828 [Pyrenula ochraceoflavens]
MPWNNEQEAYMLSFRRQNAREARRLHSQHEAIKYGIMNGQLLHPSIPRDEIQSPIADLGCGTGVWLKDLADTIFPVDKAQDGKEHVLVGFDVNDRAFDRDPPAGVHLIEQDCTEPFDQKYHGNFGLVNIRGLAYAIPEERFPSLMSNAIQLLRPGGYLQWLETDTRLFRMSPYSPEITEALKLIGIERQRRKLVSCMPHFMLSRLLSLNTSTGNFDFRTGRNAMTIINFSLVPGGLSRGSRSDQIDDAVVNESFSEVVLESVKLLLKSSMVSQESRNVNASNLARTMKLIKFIDENQKTGRVKMGGLFPLLIARKLVFPQTSAKL